jgi:hypothetical protein
MKRAFFGCLALGLVAAGCAKDPTADLGGTATYVAVQYDLVNITAGDSLVVTAETKDGQGVTLSEVPVPSSVNGVVATVSDAYLPPLPIGRFYIKGVAAGTTQVQVAAGAVSATIDVIVN